MKNLKYVLVFIFSFALSCNEQVGKTNSNSNLDRDRNTTISDEPPTFHLNDEQLNRYFSYIPHSLDSNTCPNRNGEIVSCNSSESIKLSKNNLKDLNYFPWGGYLVISRLIYNGLSSFYKNCKKYPEKRDFFKSILHTDECNHISLSDYETTVVRKFEELISDGLIELVYESTRKNIRSVIVSKHKGKKIPRNLYFDHPNGSGGMDIYISCKLDDCYFRKGINLLDRKNMFDSDFCLVFDKKPKIGFEKECERSKVEWPHIIRLYKAIKSNQISKYK